MKRVWHSQLNETDKIKYNGPTNWAAIAMISFDLTIIVYCAASQWQRQRKMAQGPEKTTDCRGQISVSEKNVPPM